jgi:threonine dehydrogenase-like Zn-dependent dehydrogenase
MPKTMNCFVMHGIGKVGFLEKPIPRPGPNDAIIRTTVALICTSDTHTVAGAIGEPHDRKDSNRNRSVVACGTGISSRSSSAAPLRQRMHMLCKSPWTWDGQS